MKATQIVLAAAFGILLVALPGQAGAQAEPSPASSCVTVAPTGAPVTISGSGDTQTAPFDLAGGAYRVEWSLTDPGRGYVGIELEPVVSAPGHRSALIVNAAGDEIRAAGDTHLYGLKPGRYYLAVDAPKSWSVTLTPFAG